MININGRSFSGRSITVINNKVIIDGQTIEGLEDQKIINIHSQGPLDTLDVDVANEIKIEGDVGKVNTVSGDVDIAGIVKGDVGTTSGDVSCDNILGSVKTVSGDVDAGSAIGGGVHTVSGDIKHRT